MLFRAVNAIDAKPGQLVTVTAESAPVLRAAAVLYLLPVLLFVLGYLLGAARWDSGAICGGVGFLLAMVLFCGLRYRINETNIPAPFRGLPVTLVAASFVSLAFYGFKGVVEHFFG